MTVDEALQSATRLLQAAETETNLVLMERLDQLACSWLAIANLLMERERA
ncbi:hypothetical protein AB0D99_31970 [Streptomyces sp. NPDC047971]